MVRRVMHVPRRARPPHAGSPHAARLAVYNFDKDWFAASRIEFVAITEQQHEAGKYVDVDEAWVRVGRWNRFDATVGRTQGFEVYHFGMGMDINTQEREGARASVGATVQQPYALTEPLDRGINNGAIALHWYLPQWLRLESPRSYGHRRRR